MSSPVTKGMILCAGLGTRLLPITERCPKPLVPVLNLPNLLHNLFVMKRAGIQEVILNLHHLGEQIEAVLGDGHAWGMKIAYSHEPVLLGTGGGVKKAEAFFQGQTFVLMNCDFVTNIELGPVIARHLQRQALATMVLFQDSLRERAYSPVGVTAASEICSLPKLKTKEPQRSGIFTGIHVLHPSTLEVLRPEPSGINEILYPHFMKAAPQRIFGEFVEGSYWYDTGNLPFLWATSQALLQELSKSPKGMLAHCLAEFGGYEEKRPGLWMKRESSLPTKLETQGTVLMGSDCHIAPGVVLGPNTVIGDHSHIGERAHVARSLLLSHAEVARGESLERSIRYGKEVLPLAE